MNVKMSDNDIEDMSFLPDSVMSNSSGKKSVYEPEGIQRCQQVVCSQRRATIIVIVFVCCVFAVALIAALARPSGSCLYDGCITTPPTPKSTSPPALLATTGEHFPWTDIRLPDSVIPLSYDLFLHPNLTTFEFNGSVTVVLTVNSKTDFIVFHSRELNLSSQHVRTESGRDIQILKVLECMDHEQVYLRLASSLDPDVKYSLHINFTGVLTNRLVGFYRSSYTTSTGEKRWLATTNFEPTDARAAFPCFDEPQLKANFTLSMVRQSYQVSLFNTRRVRDDPYQDNLRIDHFETSVTMSTYLVAFVVCDYGVKKSKTASGVEVAVYAPTELLDQTSFALSVATKVLDFYEQYYGIKYPMNKSDHIAIPDFAAGAMENWGLVTYLMQSLLFNPNESSVTDQQWVAVVVAHELAHQWFGNLVTMKWWNDLWLNEGFARFVEYLGTNAAMPQWNMLDLFIDDVITVALYNDGLISSHPISVTVEDPAEIGEIFDAISYEKGASIIRMLESFIGSEAFVGGVKRYLHSHQYSNADTHDLWAALTAQVQKSVDVREVMDTWTLQMGYPVITITRQNNLITAQQQRFLYNPRANQSAAEFTSPYNYKWFVPVTYITQSSPRRQNSVQWMKMNNISFSVDNPGSWVKMNVNMTGVYRVHYDSDNWRALIDQLNKDHTVFTTSDRASLIDDVFALARSGHVDITVALDLSLYLVDEREYVPWRIALTCLNYVGEMLEDTREYEHFATYIKWLMKGVLKEISWTMTNASHLNMLLRSTILDQSVRLGDPTSVTHAKNLFTSWSQNNSSINANLKGIVYQSGAKFGGDADWQYLWQQFQSTQTPSERNKLLYALAATNDAIKLTRYLQSSLDEAEVRSSETTSVINSVAANPAGLVIAWHFVKTNWNTLYTRFQTSPRKIARLVLSTAGRFTTLSEYEEVKSFFSVRLPGKSLRAVSQALDRIDMNIDWRQRNEAIANMWLKKHIAK